MQAAPDIVILQVDCSGAGKRYERIIISHSHRVSWSHVDAVERQRSAAFDAWMPSHGRRILLLTK
jgi:hypothetical protein